MAETISLSLILLTALSEINFPVQDPDHLLHTSWDFSSNIFMEWKIKKCRGTFHLSAAKNLITQATTFSPREPNVKLLIAFLHLGISA